MATYPASPSFSCILLREESIMNQLIVLEGLFGLIFVLLFGIARAADRAAGS
jgi:hypothetical protein